MVRTGTRACFSNWSAIMLRVCPGRRQWLVKRSAIRWRKEEKKNSGAAGTARKDGFLFYNQFHSYFSYIRNLLHDKPYTKSQERNAVNSKNSRTSRRYMKTIFFMALLSSTLLLVCYATLKTKNCVLCRLYTMRKLPQIRWENTKNVKHA